MFKIYIKYIEKSKEPRNQNKKVFENDSNDPK